MIFGATVRGAWLGFGKVRDWLEQKMRLAVRAIYSGQVQGVGFRYQTKILSAPYDVQGYVRNQVDGTVELLAEGEKAELDRFLYSVAERFSANISEADLEWCDATGAFSAFEIRRCRKRI